MVPLASKNGGQRLRETTGSLLNKVGDNGTCRTPLAHKVGGFACDHGGDVEVGVCPRLLEGLALLG